MTTRVVHINDGVPDAIYIGRAMPRRGLKQSKWANPYRIDSPLALGDPREWAIDNYKRDLLGDAPTILGCLTSSTRTKSRYRVSLADLPELRDKPLACWCRHDGEAVTDANRCHGDVLKELLDTYTDDELRAMASADTEWSL